MGGSAADYPAGAAGTACAGETPGGSARDVVVFALIHQPRRLRLPAAPLPPGASAAVLEEALFDDALNERYFRRTAERCYHPATARLRKMAGEGFKLALAITGSFLDQAARWDPDLLDELRDLVRHPHTELVAIEPAHSMLPLWDIGAFIERMHVAADRLAHVFGVRPAAASTAEMLMSDTIYHALDRAGFRAAFLDGRPRVLGWRMPTYLYHHGRGRMKLLVRHHQLSDDVGYRFVWREWAEWPLTADRYATWLARHPGRVVVVGWDYEMFGEHLGPETGIFDFLAALPAQVRRQGLAFRLPSEVVARCGAESFDLPLPALPVTWAGGGTLDFFFSNDAQLTLFQLMMQAYHKTRLTADPALMELALSLAQSDHLYTLRWIAHPGPDADVSAYFTPQEWRALGPDGLVGEIQQVYHRFIAAIG